MSYMTTLESAMQSNIWWKCNKDLISYELYMGLFYIYKTIFFRSLFFSFLFHIKPYFLLSSVFFILWRPKEPKDLVNTAICWELLLYFYHEPIFAPPEGPAQLVRLSCRYCLFTDSCSVSKVRRNVENISYKFSLLSDLFLLCFMNYDLIIASYAALAASSCALRLLEPVPTHATSPLMLIVVS